MAAEQFAIMDAVVGDRCFFKKAASLLTSPILACRAI